MIRAFTAVFLAALAIMPARAETQDADEAELLKSFGKVDVWHFPVDYTVGYNNQDVVVARELVAQPAPAGKLCYIRFDLLKAGGEYSYGFKPSRFGDAKPGVWGVYVKKIGDVTSQARSTLKMNVVYFFVDDLKQGADAAICEKKQTAQTPEAGNGFGAGEWSDLIVRARLQHGWPAARAL